jgi:hypothetical protein
LDSCEPTMDNLVELIFWPKKQYRPVAAR